MEELSISAVCPGSRIENFSSILAVTLWAPYRISSSVEICFMFKP